VVAGLLRVAELAGGVYCLIVLILDGLIGRSALDEWSPTGKEKLNNSLVSLQRILPLHGAIDSEVESNKIFDISLAIQSYIFDPELMFYGVHGEVLGYFVHALLGCFYGFCIEGTDLRLKPEGNVLED
jgi:hypothetical protein